MPSWSSLGKEELIKYCDHYGIQTDNKDEKDLIQELKQVDDKKFLHEKPQSHLEELSKHGQDLDITPCSTFNHGVMYTIITVNKQPTLHVVILDGMITAKETLLKPIGNISFDKRGLFFHKETLYYMYRFSLYKIDMDTGEVTMDLNVHLALLPKGEFLNYQNDNIWYYAVNMNCILVYDLIKKKISKVWEFGRNENIDVQSLISIGNSLFLPDVRDLRNYSRFHKTKPDDSTFFNSMCQILEKILFGSYFVDEKNETVYVAGGFLYHCLGLPSNEIHIFDFQNERHEVHYLPIRLTPRVICFDNQYLYLLNSFHNGKNSNFRVGIKNQVLNGYAGLIPSSMFSDIVIHVKGKDYKLHKFLLHEYTILDVTKDELTLDLTQYEMEFIVQWMYNGNCFMDTYGLNATKMEKILGVDIKKHSKQQEDHGSYLFDKIEISKSFHDFEIICDNGNSKFYTHRAVLSLKSEYFKSMFVGDFVESNVDFVELNEFSRSHILTMLKFFYVGNINVNADFKDIVQSIEISQYFMSKLYEQKLWKYLLSCINESNSFAIYDFASDFKSSEASMVQKLALEKIKQNYSTSEVIKIMTKLRKREFEEIEIKRKKY